MQEVLLDYGDSRMRVELPDSAVVVRYGKTYTDPPEIDPFEATRKALESPLGFPPCTNWPARIKKWSSVFRTASREGPTPAATGGWPCP